MTELFLVRPGRNFFPNHQFVATFYRLHLGKILVLKNLVRWFVKDSYSVTLSLMGWGEMQKKHPIVCCCCNVLFLEPFQVAIFIASLSADICHFHPTFGGKAFGFHSHVEKMT